MTHTAEHLAAHKPDQVRATYRITADTPDDELPVTAQAIQRAEDIAPYGLKDYVRRLRDNARDTERTALSEISAEIRRLIAEQHKLIRRLAAWGDSVESLG